MQCDPLGDQLAEDQREEGDGEHHNGDRNTLGGFCQPGDAGEQPGQLVHGGLAAQRTGKDANGGDEDLHGGKQAVGFIQQAQGGHCPGVAIFGPGQQAGFARGYQGHLCQREEAVGQN